MNSMFALGSSAIIGIILVVIAIIVAAVLIGRANRSKNADHAADQTGAASPAVVSAAAAPVVPAAVQTLTAPGSAGEIKLHNVPDKQAAMVMAIVADHLKAPLNQLRFKSIKQID